METTTQFNPLADIPKDAKPIDKVMVIISKGTLESIYAGFILANGARMEGIESEIFFTFFGLEAVNKKTIDNIHVATVGTVSYTHLDVYKRQIYDYGGEEVDFDLLVTVPTNMGDDSILRSGFGNDLNYVPTDKHTLQSKIKENIFVIGDATDVPTSKAGSVAHFEAEILTENILNYIEGKPLKPNFDGHANCFIETGKGKALLIDFNYEVEPVKGKFPFGGIGPLNLLTESKFNHWGKTVSYTHLDVYKRQGYKENEIRGLLRIAKE